MVIFDNAQALDQIRSVIAEMKKQLIIESDGKDKGNLQNVKNVRLVTQMFNLHTVFMLIEYMIKLPQENSIPGIVLYSIRTKATV